MDGVSQGMLGLSAPNSESGGIAAVRSDFIAMDRLTRVLGEASSADERAIEFSCISAGFSCKSTAKHEFALVYS
jgi:hypothetical protein